MVTIAVLAVAISVVLGLAGGLPSWSVDSTALATSSTQVGAAAAMANGYFPVTTLGACLAVVVGLKVVLQLWNLAVWVWHQFWGSS